MNFIIRSVRIDDRKQLMELARQFTLLNLPTDKTVLSQKIETSIQSFNRELSQSEAEYIFVVEDIDDGIIAGSSQIVGKKGTPEKPAYSFQVIKKERFSKDLGVGFIHQVLRLKVETDGSAELGGLVIDRGYRRMPEKLGQLASLIRFLYIAMSRDSFGKKIHAELVPPLTEEGRSEFWEALGRRFTGMPYVEADALSQQNKNFIQDLFPEEDIYLALLDSKARLVLGRVGEETQGAEHMLKKLGFKYKNEVDPFDGGPHLSADLDEVPLVNQAKKLISKSATDEKFETSALIGLERDGEFLGGCSSYAIQGENIVLPSKTFKALEIQENQEIYFTPL